MVDVLSQSKHQYAVVQPCDDESLLTAQVFGFPFPSSIFWYVS